MNSHILLRIVDNHDIEPGQALESLVERWFKTIEYSIIFLRFVEINKL